MAKSFDDNVSESDLAKQFGLSVPGLRGWKKRGYGPRSFKLGRAVFYDRADVDAFVQQEKAGR